MFNLETRARPILKWPGGKSQLLPQLISRFPAEFDRYVEPFVGGAAVYLALNPFVPAWINDVNAELPVMYETVAWDPHTLMALLDQHAQCYSESYYYQVRATRFTTDVGQAARTIFLNKTCFNGLYRQNSQGQFNVAWGKAPVCPGLYDADNLLAASDRLKRATITCLDFEDVIDRTGEGDFIYCDPPYAPLSKTANFTKYAKDGFTEDDQRRLEAALRRAAQRGAKVALSNSSAPFILDLYRSWTVHPIEATRRINRNATGRGPVTEILAVL